MSPEHPKKRKWWHPRTIAGAWAPEVVRDGKPNLGVQRRTDEHVRKAAGGAAKLGGLTLVAVLLIRSNERTQASSTTQLVAAIADEAAERRVQHNELRSDLQEVRDAVRAKNEGEGEFRSTVYGTIQGRLRCPTCPSLVCKAPPPCPDLRCPPVTVTTIRESAPPQQQPQQQPPPRPNGPRRPEDR